MDLKQFIVEFQDHLAPKLDTYEQDLPLPVPPHAASGKGARDHRFQVRSESNGMWGGRAWEAHVGGDSLQEAPVSASEGSH